MTGDEQMLIKAVMHLLGDDTPATRTRERDGEEEATDSDGNTVYLRFHDDRCRMDFYPPEPADEDADVEDDPAWTMSFTRDALRDFLRVLTKEAMNAW